MNESQSPHLEQGFEQILTCLSHFVQDELLTGGEITEVGPEDDLLGSGLIDSLGVMRTVAFIEKTYHLSIPPEDVRIEHFIDLGSLAKYVESLLSTKGQS